MSGSVYFWVDPGCKPYWASAYTSPTDYIPGGSNEITGMRVSTYVHNGTNQMSFTAQVVTPAALYSASAGDVITLSARLEYNGSKVANATGYVKRNPATWLLVERVA